MDAEERSCSGDDGEPMEECSCAMSRLPDAHLLPPCKVCGVQASGFHYGVNTCDACKAFFQRSIRRHSAYECTRRNSMEKKTECKHCRYEKCVNAGMSVAGIKIGRYTSIKKANDVLERQRIRQQQPPGDEDDDPKTGGGATKDFDDSVSEEEIRQLIDVVVQAQHHQVPNITAHLRELPDIQRRYIASGHRHSENCECGLDAAETSCRQKSVDTSADCDVTSSTGGPDDVRRHPDRPQLGAADRRPSADPADIVADRRTSDAAVAGRISAADVESRSQQPQQQQQQPKKHLVAKATPGASSPDGVESPVRGATGGGGSGGGSAHPGYDPAAIDDRLLQMLPSWRVSDEETNDERRHVLHRWLVTLEKGLRGIVGFVKEVPGFSQLPTGDKINLVKRSICESWLVTRHRAFNRDYGCFTAFNGFTFDLVQAVGEQFSSVLFKAADRMQALKLTDEETFVLKAFVVFFTDGVELEDRQGVEAIQNRLLAALRYLFARSHPDDPLIVAKLIGAVTELRNVGDAFQRLIDGIIVLDDGQHGSDKATKIPPLFWEVLLQR